MTCNYCRSHPDGGKFSQLVTLESLSRTRENNQSSRAQKNNCEGDRPVCASRLAPEVTEASGWFLRPGRAAWFSVPTLSERKPLRFFTLIQSA